MIVNGGFGNGAIDGGGVGGVDEDESGKPGGTGGKVIGGGVRADKATTVLNGLTTTSGGCMDTGGALFCGLYAFGLTPKRKLCNLELEI